MESASRRVPARGAPIGFTPHFQLDFAHSTLDTHLMKSPTHLLVLAALTLWLCGCATNSVKRTWKSPAYEAGPPRKISVLAVDERGDVRAAFENRLVKELRASGQDAAVTYSLLDLPEIKSDKAVAAARLSETGADAILVVRLVDQATYSREVQATPELYVPVATGAGSYGWYDYYSVAFDNLGVVWGSTTQSIYLDCSLFDLKTGQRLWSAQTVTVLKEDADRLAVGESLIAKVVKAMRKDGLVGP